MKLLHKVVKSSQGFMYNGVVAIDNTVVVKPKAVEIDDDDIDEVEEKNRQIEQRIQIEVSNRLAAQQRALSEKEKKAFEDIQNQKNKIVSEALLQAKKIKDDAEHDAIIIKENAREKGYEEGLEDGKREAVEQQQKNIDATVKLLADINQAKESLYISHENEILDLAYEITQKITLSEIKTDKSIVFNIVKQALKSFRNSDYVKISLAKSDVSADVVTDEEFLKKIAGNIPYIDIELLPDAKSGTVLLDNDKEIIDASVPTQLDLLKEILNNSKKPED